MKPFSIFIPAYNEADLLKQNVRRLLDYASGLNTPYEIIVVSNGSTDATERVGTELAAQYGEVKFLAIPQKGVGRAFKKGIEKAKHDHIIFMDADLSADLAFIDKANQSLDQHVLVLGAKFKGLQNRSLFRKMGSLVFYLSVLALMRMAYVDYAPGAKAYRRGFLLEYSKYIDDYTSFVLNLTFIASIKKLPIKEIPIECDDRRQSRFNLWHEAVSKYQGLFNLKIKQLLGKL